MKTGGHQTPETRAKIAATLKGRRPKNNMTWVGENHPNWKGGIRISEGYRLILSPNHPNKNHQGYMQEHRLVMELKLGRLLEPQEVVHHLDRNRLNNDPENLVLCATHKEHIEKYHKDSGKATRFRKGRFMPKLGEFISCIVCGNALWVTPARKKDGRGKYCSTACLYRRNYV